MNENHEDNRRGLEARSKAMEDKIEKVAIAIAKHEGVAWDLAIGSRGVVRMRFRSMAKAAIEAIEALK